MPLRWEDDRDLEELTAYLERLVEMVDVTVVDGSSGPLFEAHRRVWPRVRHLTPSWPGLNGKACGTMTGLAASRHERVIVADDDVRYDAEGLRAVLERLDTFDFVRPQNYFAPLPWHARWDTGRSLLNRALGGDFSGTVALRRSILPPTGYDTDVLFENLQLERTVRAHGGRVDVARDLYVARMPPRTGRFWEQRVRQAYDGFAQPARLLRELLILPLAIAAVVRTKWRMLALAAGAVVAVAELGRRRGGGASRYPPTASLWAVPWVVERALTSWIAVAQRLRGGMPYRGTRIARACSRVGPRAIPPGAGGGLPTGQERS